MDPDDFPAPQDGFVLTSGSDGSTIEGLTIQNYQGAAIHVFSGTNLIQGTTLGTTAPAPFPQS